MSFDYLGRRTHKAQEPLDDIGRRLDQLDVSPALQAPACPVARNDGAVADDDARGFKFLDAREARAWREAHTTGKLAIGQARVIGQKADKRPVRFVQPHARASGGARVFLERERKRNWMDAG